MSRPRKAPRQASAANLSLDLFGPAAAAPADDPPIASAAIVSTAEQLVAPLLETGARIAVDDATVWLAEAFAERLVTWAERAGAPDASLDALRRAGYRASIATAAGHTCTMLAELDPSTDMRAALLASRMVGTHHQPAARPLLLDGDGRLYLHRYFAYEVRIARRLARGRERVLAPEDEQRLAAVLAQLFGSSGASGESDWQKLAAALAVINPFTLISGGPGTGKTTTVVNLLAALLELYPDCRVVLAAPTGKAAARMQSAIRDKAAVLPAGVRERLPQESFTIHRLLGVLPDGGGFRHHAGNPLAVDVLVVDEASMLDLALAARLFDAVPEDARIVLLGDKDQLAAVESGAVFAELSADPRLTPACSARLADLCNVPASAIEARAPAATPRSPLTDRVVWFTRNFRFSADSGIGRLAAEVRAGDADAALRALTSVGDGSIAWVDDADAELAPERLAALQAGYAPYVESVAAYVAVLRSGRDPRAALDDVFVTFDRYRVLCAERVGRRGVAAVNARLGIALRALLDAAWPSPARSPWHAGRPVMILRNDYVLKLFNGDVGIALPDATGELVVHFRDTAGAVRALAPVRLPELDDAYAITVHKAQGSEFGALALVLPGRESRVLSRELLYTGITRGRDRVTIVGGAEALRAAIASPTMRHSGLLARLAEAS